MGARARDDGGHARGASRAVETAISFAAMRLPRGAVFGGRFTIEEHLADGGFGAVYRARDERAKVVVALKVLHAEFVAKPKIRVRFELEAAVASRVDSPHAIKGVDAGVDEPTGQPWVAMEFLDGETFDALLEREGRLSPARLAEIIEPIGDALAAAHRAGVIHADLKPENVMLVRGGVKVLDFGIARVLRDGVTSTEITSTLGSPLFTAPEQFLQGARLRPSADVWPLGMIAFLALTGKRYLLNAQPPVRIMACILEIVAGELPTASERARALGVEAHLPPEFDLWFKHCVTRDPEARFQHGHAAVTALLTLLRPRPSIPATRIVEDIPLLSALSVQGTVALPPAALVAVAAMLERSDYAAARDALATALSAHEDNAAAWALRASCDHRLGRYEDARDAWSEALVRAPSTTEYLRARALTFDALGLPSLARADRALASR